MIDTLAKVLKAPWRVIGLKCLDSEDRVICEAYNKETANLIATLPDLCSVLLSISKADADILYSIGGEDITCSKCESLISAAQESIPSIVNTLLRREELYSAIHEEELNITTAKHNADRLKRELEQLEKSE